MSNIFQQTIYNPEAAIFQGGLIKMNSSKEKKSELEKTKKDLLNFAIDREDVK